MTNAAETNTQKLEQALEETQELKDKLLSTVQQADSKIEDLQKLIGLMRAMYAPPTPFDIRKGDKYYYTEPDGTTGTYEYADDNYDRLLIERGEACKDIDLTELFDHYVVLKRLMLRYSIQHGGEQLLDKKVWQNENITKYYCLFDYDTSKWVTSWAYSSRQHDVYFIDEQTAENCINDVIIPYCEAHPELGYGC